MIKIPLDPPRDLYAELPYLFFVEERPVRDDGTSRFTISKIVFVNKRRHTRDV